ncbi:hypothetical protein L1887_03023 [Cichorium endivia]|nr:hypothetical protein L1887_03023 [Cichorium endivia]
MRQATEKTKRVSGFHLRLSQLIIFVDCPSFFLTALEISLDADDRRGDGFTDRRRRKKVALGERGKRNVVVEGLPVVKATQQKQRRMINNKESGVMSRERKQLYSLILRYGCIYGEQDGSLQIALDSDPRSYIFGEDVGFGGVFRCTTGLAEQFD